MTSSHPTFFPGTFNDPAMVLFPPSVCNQDMASSMDLAYSSTTFEMQQDHQFTEKAMYYENWYPAQAVHPFQASDHVAPSSWPSHWSSYPAQHMHSSSYDDLSPSPSPQGASFNCNRSNNVSKPSLLSWPIECFVTNNPMHANNDSELVQSTFAPIPPHTPELLYTSSSTDESANVFDIQFGQSLQGSSYLGDNRFSSDSPPSSCSPSPLPKRRSMPISTEAIKHLQQDTRTPSPSLESNSPSPADYRRRFPCLLPGCERRFTSRYTLKVHMEAHKPKPKVSFPCTQGCSERFSRQHDRLRHEVAKHGKICEFLCDECGRFFSTKKTLGNHKCPLAVGGTRWVHNS